MSYLSSLPIEELGSIFTKGIAADLEVIIRKQLHDKVDHIIDELAVSLAQKIAVKVQSMQYADALNGTQKILLNVYVDRKKIADITAEPQVNKVDNA